MNLNHPAIVNHVPKPIDFLSWVAQQGHHVAITMDGLHYKASLERLANVWCGAEGRDMTEWCAYGATAELAVDKLAAHCSNQEYYPQAKRVLGFIKAGPAYRFPRFV